MDISNKRTGQRKSINIEYSEQSISRILDVGNFLITNI